MDFLETSFEIYVFPLHFVLFIMIWFFNFSSVFRIILIDLIHGIEVVQCRQENHKDLLQTWRTMLDSYLSTQQRAFLDFRLLDVKPGKVSFHYIFFARFLWKDSGFSSRYWSLKRRALDRLCLVVGRRKGYIPERKRQDQGKKPGTLDVNETLKGKTEVGMEKKSASRNARGAVR